MTLDFSNLSIFDPFSVEYFILLYHDLPEIRHVDRLNPSQKRRKTMAKNKKSAELNVIPSTKPKLARPSKPMSSYMKADELKLIIERANKLGDLEYAALAHERLLELQPVSTTTLPKKAARPAKARLTA